MQGAPPGKPLVAGSRRLVVYVLYAKAVQRYVEVIDALVHSGRLVGAYAYVQQVIVIVQRNRIHLRVATVAGAAAGAAESAYPAEQLRVVQANRIGLETAQGEAADGAVVAVRKGAEAGVEGGQGLLYGNFLKSIEIEQVEA